MQEPKFMTESSRPTGHCSGKMSRWLRRLKWLAVAVVALFLVGLFVIQDHLRTLTSLRRVAGTNAFVMDYYLDYHPEQIRKHGLDMNDLEGCYIKTLLPRFAVPIANRVKRFYLPNCERRSKKQALGREI